MKYHGKFNITVSIAIVILAFQAGCMKPPDEQKAQPVRTNVEVWRVVASRMVDEVTLPGVVEPVSSVTISSEVAGKIKKLHVKEGDEVAENMLLLEVDGTDLALNVDQAAARVREFEAIIREKKSGARPEELAQLKAAVESAMSARDLAADQAKRRKKLFEDGILAEELYESAQTALTAAEKGLEQAEEGYKLAQKGAREETIEANEARLASARTALELIKRTHEKIEVRSPLTGVVDEKFVEEGELVSPGKKLFQIITADKVKVVVWAPERVMTKIHNGDSVRLAFDALNKSVEAPISRVAFAADSATRTFKTEILLDNPLSEDAAGNTWREYRVGYIASATFRVGEVPEAVKIPVEALVMQETRLVVYTAKPDADEKSFIAVVKDVEIGLKNKDSLEIRRGIKPGDTIIVKGQRFVRDGEAVKVVKTHEESWPW
jgi:RND family efflux transporter MFP subunit